MTKGDKTSEASDGSQRGQMGSVLWARPVQLGVCFAPSWAGHCRRKAREMQQYGEIRSWSGAGAVWTEKSRRHRRNFLGAYHRGPSSPPLSHPRQIWCRRTVRAAAQPSPVPAAVRHRGSKTHRSRVRVSVLVWLEI